MFGPCCFGISLRRAVQSLAILEILIGSVGFICGWIGLFVAVYHLSGKFPSEHDHADEKSISEMSVTPAGVAFTFTIVTSISEVCLSIWLLLGANQGNIGKCKTWLAVEYALFTVGLLFLCTSIFDHAVSINNIVIYTIIYAFYNCYLIWVVRSFIVELNNNLSSARVVMNELV